MPETRPGIPLSDDIHRRLPKVREARPETSQRQLAEVFAFTRGNSQGCYAKAVLDEGRDAASAP